MGPEDAAASGCAPQDDSRSVWYQLDGFQPGIVTVDAAGSSAGTGVRVFRGPPGSAMEIACGRDELGPIRIPLVLTAGQTYWVRIANWRGSGGYFQWYAQQDAVILPPQAPTNDSVSRAVVLAPIPSFLQGSNAGATTAGEDPAPSCAGSSYRSVWYKITAPANARLSFDTTGSGQGLVMTVYRGTPTASRQLVCSASATGAAQTMVDVRAATTYYVRIASLLPTGGYLQIYTYLM